MYQPHTLVTLGGTIDEKGGQDEIWQFGVRGFQSGGGPVDPAQLDRLALEILRGPTGSGGGVEGLFGDVKSKIPVTATLKWCKAANIAPNGSYSSAPGYAQFAGASGSGNPAVPSFCSIAISWSTGKSFGKALRGRIYPPNFGAPIAAGSTISGANLGDIADWAQLLLKAIDHSASTTGTFDFNPYVVSSSGVSNPITGIRVGNVYDTQRRRKDAVPESYVTRPTLGPSGD